MKKIIFILLALLVVISSGQTALAENKEYRIGIKGGVFYPSCGSDTMVKSDTIMLTLELDFKRNSRLDTGLRIGYDAFATRAPSYYACYDLFQFGYGIRYYFDERQSPETSYHTFKRYVMADGYLTLGNKTKDLESTISAAQNLYGVAAKLGAGIEYVFGPYSSGFIDAEYLVMNSKASNGNYEFPINGGILAFGVRLAK